VAFNTNEKLMANVQTADWVRRTTIKLVIPWFNDSFVRDGQSVCKGHWVAIRHGKRTCYAQ